MKLFNLNFPLTSRNKHIGRGKDWVNSTVKSSSVKLKDLFILSQKYPDLRDVYRKKLIEHRLLIRKTKRTFFQRRINALGCNSRGLWKVVGDISGRSSSRTHNICIRGDNGELVSDPVDVAQSFNIYFKNVAINIVDNIPSATAEEYADILIQQNSMFLFPCTPGEVEVMISSRVKGKWSAGSDSVPTNIVKGSLPLTSHVWCHLINLSFASGRFPQMLKAGQVTPIFKRGDKENMANYRPITVASGFSKVFEYAFVSRLESYLESNKILAPNQFGSRAKTWYYGGTL